ncbi:MAG: GerMN domain-containing protein [Acidimicrobiales bacterium]
MKRPAMVVAVLSLALLAGCGAGVTDPEGAGTVPGRPATTLAPPTGGGGGGETTEVTLYFVKGERVDTVRRAVPKVARIGAEAVKALVGGPNEAERGAAFTTAIPAGTQFRDLTIDNGLARVDLSRTFESGGGALGLTLRLAQVACTLDAFESVTGVRFALDGQVVDVISGDGIVVDRPVTCDSYKEYVGPAPSPGPIPAVFAGIWPFATAAELATYDTGADQTFREATNTARLFAERYLGFTGPQLFPFRSTGTGAGEVPVGFGRGEGGLPVANPQATTVVQLRQLGRTGTGGPWTVVGATSPDIEVDAPAILARVSSPVAVTGRARAFEGNVVVEVREDGMVKGQSIGKGNVTGRGDGVLGPFRGEITFRSPTKAAGAVVFYEPSAADGSTLRAAVVRVDF